LAIPVYQSFARELSTDRWLREDMQHDLSVLKHDLATLGLYWSTVLA
jgi:hypothetical protein